MARRFRTNLFTGEVEELNDGSENGRSVVKGALPFGATTVQGRAGQTWIGPCRPNKSMSLAVPLAQVGRFNAKLEEYGIGGARYSGKTGALESTDRESRAAAFAIRGYHDGDGGDVEEKWGAAIGY